MLWVKLDLSLACTMRKSDGLKFRPNCRQGISNLPYWKSGWQLSISWHNQDFKARFSQLYQTPKDCTLRFKKSGSHPWGNSSIEWELSQAAWFVRAVQASQAFKCLTGSFGSIHYLEQSGPQLLLSGLFKTAFYGMHCSSTPPHLEKC